VYIQLQYGEHRAYTQHAVGLFTFFPLFDPQSRCTFTVDASTGRSRVDCNATTPFCPNNVTPSTTAPCGVGCMYNCGTTLCRLTFNAIQQSWVVNCPASPVSTVGGVGSATPTPAGARTIQPFCPNANDQPSSFAPCGDGCQYVCSGQNCTLSLSATASWSVRCDSGGVSLTFANLASTGQSPQATVPRTFGTTPISSVAVETTNASAPTTTSAAITLEVTAVSADSTTPGSAETANANWIDSAAAIPTIGGVVGGLAGCVLLGIGAYCVGLRRGRRRRNNPQSAVPTEMHTARADSSRTLSTGGDSGAHYGTVPAPKPSSHYLEHAGEFKVAQSEPLYVALSAAEAGELDPHYAVPTTPHVSVANGEPEPPYDVLSDEEA
jgi:hypothetical protein